MEHGAPGTLQRPPNVGVLRRESERHERVLQRFHGLLAVPGGRFGKQQVSKIVVKIAWRRRFGCAPPKDREGRRPVAEPKLRDAECIDNVPIVRATIAAGGELRLGALPIACPGRSQSFLLALLVPRLVRVTGQFQPIESR